MIDKDALREAWKTYAKEVIDASKRVGELTEEAIKPDIDKDLADFSKMLNNVADRIKCEIDKMQKSFEEEVPKSDNEELHELAADFKLFFMARNKHYITPEAREVLAKAEGYIDSLLSK